MCEHLLLRSISTAPAPAPNFSVRSTAPAQQSFREKEPDLCSGIFNLWRRVMRKLLLSVLVFLPVLASRLPAQEPPATGEAGQLKILIEKLRSPELGVRFQAVKELRKLE